MYPRVSGGLAVQLEGWEDEAHHQSKDRVLTCHGVKVGHGLEERICQRRNVLCASLASPCVNSQIQNPRGTGKTSPGDNTTWLTRRPERSN